MLRQSSRKLWKRALGLSRLKLLYARIVLNRFTTLYFATTLISCIVLVSLQVVAYHDNTEGAAIISNILNKANFTDGLTFYEDGALQFCHGIPSDSDAECEVITLRQIPGPPPDLTPNASTSAPHHKRGDQPIAPVFDANGFLGIRISTGEILPTPCLESLLWLRDLLHDARREDVVTLLFLLWMFGLSIVTILNESLPHLGATLAGHVLGSAWAGYRVANSKSLRQRYYHYIVEGTCNNVDVMGDWWDIRTNHTIPVIVLHAVALLVLLYLSVNLYKVYADQSFTRVGASTEINNIYKIVLLLSVLLQLVGFFSIAATGMWLDKITSSSLRPYATHLPLYLAAFAVTAVLEFPWVVLGWISVRRENRHLFVAFGLISLSLLGISSFMFSSSLYRFIFMCWPFFAVMTITSYVLLVAASALAVICRLHFGKGLAQYLRVKDVLEGMDFTPVNFIKNNDDTGSMLKRSDSGKSSIMSYDEKPSSKLATLKYHQTADEPRQPVAVHPARAKLSLSIYSDTNRPTMKMSSTPPLARSITSSKASSISRMSSSTTYTNSSTGSVPVSVPVPVVREVPPVPAITTTTSRSISQVSRKTPPELSPIAASPRSIGLPTNPRPGSPVMLRTQPHIQTQQKPPMSGEGGYF